MNKTFLVKDNKIIVPEGVVQSQLADYLKMQYPEVLFHSDTGSLAGMSIQKGLQKKRQNKYRGWPDLFIVEARHGYAGMFLEIKRFGEKLYRKNGNFYSDHIKEQMEMRKMLMARNYFCEFAIGFDCAKDLIDWYLNENRPSLTK